MTPDILCLTLDRDDAQVALSRCPVGDRDRAEVLYEAVQRAQDALDDARDALGVAS